MSDKRHQRVTELFFEVCDLDPKARTRALDRACVGEDGLRAKVEALIKKGHSDARSSLTQIVEQGAEAATLQFIDEHKFAPDELGPYSIVREIGEGGMSVVYEAHQSEPVRRDVALKVIRPGMDTREVISRFESERQALAVMDHPHIATIFDGGASDNGRPYFVMELVDGERITDFCDARKFSIPDRLSLFIDVCSAIQHAHQKGVVHRDLKPSNILVTEQDGRAVPKVIDFGIAKAVDASLSDDPLVTRLGQLVGTPGYMSPEQAMARGLDVDTRTDVYALGVVLYQLLCGVLPHELQNLSHSEICDIATTRPTPRPSTRIAQLGEQQSDLAKQRDSDPGQLRRTLADSLDWVVLKAMEKNRERRYQSVSAFVIDIENYLHHRPVRARPPSRSYVLQQFVRRNRKVVTAVSLIVLALVAGVTLATVGFVRASEAERVAKREAETTKKTLDFMVDLFKADDPSESLGEDILVKDIFERGVERVKELESQPEVQARLMHTMGLVYRNAAEYEKARPLLARALEQWINANQENSSEVADTLLELGELQRIDGDLEAARRSHERALEIKRKLYGDQHISVAASLVNVGQVMVDDGSYDEGEAMYRRGLDIFRGQQQESTDVAGYLASALNDLAVVREKQGDLVEAERVYRQALVLRRELHGDVHTEIASTLNNLGTVLSKQTKLDDAEAAYREALAIREKVYGPNHDRVGVTLNNLGLLLRKRGDLSAAESLYRRSLAIRQAKFGDRPHTSVATALNNLAGLLRARGDVSGAEVYYRQARDVFLAASGINHPSTAIVQTNLAAALIELGRTDSGCAEIEAALPVLVSALGAHHWRVAMGQSVHGSCLAGGGQFADAETLLVPSLGIIREARGDDAVYSRRAIERLVSLYDAWGKPEELRRYQTLLADVTDAGLH